MTANKIKKEDLTKIFNEVDASNLNKETLYAIKKVVDNEMQCSIHKSGTDKYFTERNMVCFENMLKHLFDNNLQDAWWEFTDIISFHAEEDYLSVDEVALLNIGLTLMLNKL